MSSLIARRAMPEVRDRGLEPLVTGSDVNGIRHGRGRGDDFVITGEKTSLTMLAIVPVARTDHGSSASVVPLDAPGVATSPIADTGRLPMGAACCVSTVCA